MGTRTIATLAPTQQSMVQAAFICGYGGHYLITPHAPLKELWWTDDRIEAKVTRQFVVSKLRGEEREFLNRTLAFGEGLTDDTYMEWILDRAKRLFLVLAEIGVPDQVFGVIDDSWGDDDLPIPFDSVDRLELAYENDIVLNRRFYDTQFKFLLRELRQGDHIDYGPNEHIPMEYVHKLPPAVSLQAWDRIHFPKQDDKTFTRRRFDLASKERKDAYRAEFMADVQKAQSLRHEHIAPIWASYTCDNQNGYILSDLVAEHTLGTFIDHRTPPQFQRVASTERPILLLEWMHCLSDAVASLHHRGAHHGAICPSNILIDQANHIYFADVGTLPTFQRDKKIDAAEMYNYSAHELHILKTPHKFALGPSTSTSSHFGKLRKVSTDSSGSSDRSVTSSTKSNPTDSVVGSPVLTSPNPDNHRPSPPSSSFRNFSRHLHLPTSLRSTSPPDHTPESRSSWPSYIDPRSLCDLPARTPEKSDVFALGCVFLDILTFLVKGRTTDFVKHRTTMMDGPGRSGKKPDASFAADSMRIDAWMEHLRDEAWKRDERCFRSVPELLKLVRRMLCQNSELRPSAREARDRIETVLVADAGIERLCCLGREWEDSDPKAALGPDIRDSVSVAIGVLAVAPAEDPDAISGVESRSERRRSSASVAVAKILPWQSTRFRTP
ncbi:hypothetical protein LTR66_011112 [Elasticomyces elasticus]|nr:hypothetical protein LTR66_011112 [Elasticomyces elasticus]